MVSSPGTLMFSCTIYEHFSHELVHPPNFSHLRTQKYFKMQRRSLETFSKLLRFFIYCMSLDGDTVLTWAELALNRLFRPNL